MKRSTFYWGVYLISYVASIVILARFDYDLSGCMFLGLICALLGLVLGVLIDAFVSLRFPGLLYTPFETLRKLAADRITRRESLHDKMLFKMQYMQGLERTIAELNEIFEANRDLKLTRWIVFRAWYKDQIDHMLKYPNIYHLTVGGEPYNKEDDPLYDRNAPDWSIYDREHNYDDDDDDDDELDDYSDNHKRNRYADALATGMGIGLVNGLTDGSVFGGGSDGS